MKLFEISKPLLGIKGVKCYPGTTKYQPDFKLFKHPRLGTISIRESLINRSRNWKNYKYNLYVDMLNRDYTRTVEGKYDHLINFTQLIW